VFSIYSKAEYSVTDTHNTIKLNNRT